MLIFCSNKYFVLNLVFSQKILHENVDSKKSFQCIEKCNFHRLLKDQNSLKVNRIKILVMLYADFKNAIMRKTRSKFLLHDTLRAKLKIKSALHLSILEICHSD